MSENTGSDLKQVQSSSITTENRRLQTTQPHRKTLIEACKPMHISDARNQQRGVCGGNDGSRNNTNVNHEEECNSSASVSNSIERCRTPNTPNRVTGPQTSPSPSSSASREGTATDKQLSDLEYEEPSSEDNIRSRARKQTTAGTTRYTSSDRETESKETNNTAIYSRLKTKHDEELHHEGDDEDEEEEQVCIKHKPPASPVPPSPKPLRHSGNPVFSNPNKPHKKLLWCQFKNNKSKFTHSNIVDLPTIVDKTVSKEKEEKENFFFQKEKEIGVPILKHNKTSSSAKHTGINMVGDTTDIALNGDTIERQELTAMDPSAKRSILRNTHDTPFSSTINTSDDAPDVTYVTRLDKDGNIEQVPDDCDETTEVNPNPLADFMSADILTKPFNFVSGSATKSRFNPFRKKSGLLNVLARQSTKNRIVAKSGALNTINEYHSTKFWKDIFITMIDMNWGYIFLIFASAFFSSWLAFAVVWYVIIWQHGDFVQENIDRIGIVATNETTPFVPCADNIQGFTSCFLFSLETQHTIGYGGRATTEQCPVAIIVMSFQSILGVIIQACMAGIIFAKFTVPRARGETIVYSKNAVITIRNGALYLLCRVSDLRKSSLLEAHVRMLCVKKEVTEEGEVIPYYQFDLECGSELDGSNDRVLMFWPTTLAHKIDEDSPLYELNPRDLLQSQFEIIVTLEGVTEETGNTIQVRTSYLPNEILWGHHFDNNIVKYDSKIACHIVCHGIINRTATDETPRVSAKQLERRKARASQASNRGNSSGGASITESDSRSEESPDKKVSIISTTPGSFK